MKCVVLDDYQDVAMHFADWSVLHGVDVVPVRRHMADADDVVRTLKGAEIVVRDAGAHPAHRVDPGPAARPSSWW